MYQEIASTRLRVDPADIAHAAGQMLDLGAQLAQLTRTLPSDLDLEPALGTLPAATRLARACRQHADDMHGALAALTQRMEADADRLYRVAFAAQEADQAALARGRRVIARPGGQW